MESLNKMFEMDKLVSLGINVIINFIFFYLNKRKIDVLEEQNKILLEKVNELESRMQFVFSRLGISTLNEQRPVGNHPGGTIRNQPMNSQLTPVKPQQIQRAPPPPVWSPPTVSEDDTVEDDLAAQRSQKLDDILQEEELKNQTEEITSKSLRGCLKEPAETSFTSESQDSEKKKSFAGIEY